MSDGIAVYSPIQLLDVILLQSPLSKSDTMIPLSESGTMIPASVCLAGHNISSCS